MQPRVQSVISVTPVTRGGPTSPGHISNARYHRRYGQGSGRRPAGAAGIPGDGQALPRPDGGRAARDDRQARRAAPGRRAVTDRRGRAHGHLAVRRRAPGGRGRRPARVHPGALRRRPRAPHHLEVRVMTHPWQPSIPPEWPAPAFPADPRPPFAPPARPHPSYFVPVGPDPVSERLYEQRIVLAHGELTPERATAWCAQLLTLGAIGRDPITLHLSIPDGGLGATLTLLDTLDSLTVEVTAVVAGRLGGPPVGLLTAVTHRQATPNSVLRLGEPRLAAVGTAEEVAAADEQGRDR